MSLSRYKTLADCASNVRTFFDTIQLKIHPSSRIDRMTGCLFDENGDPRFVSIEDPTFSYAKQAHRDLLQIDFIVDQLLTITLTPLLLSKLKDLCKDNVQPEDDLKGISRGRDAQCELYFLAVCIKAGFDPVIAEPDIVCTHQHIEYGLAVKRIKKLAAFEKRIRGAAKQVYNSKRTGIIAADISLATNEGNESIDVILPEAYLKDSLKKRTDIFVHDHMQSLLQWTKHKWVSGVILVFNDLCADSEKTYGFESFTASVAVSDNDRRRKEFIAFSNAFELGLATPANS